MFDLGSIEARNLEVAAQHAQQCHQPFVPYSPEEVDRYDDLHSPFPVLRFSDVNPRKWHRVAFLSLLSPIELRAKVREWVERYEGVGFAFLQDRAKDVLPLHKILAVFRRVEE